MSCVCKQKRYRINKTNYKCVISCCGFISLLAFLYSSYKLDLLVRITDDCGRSHRFDEVCSSGGRVQESGVFVITDDHGRGRRFDGIGGISGGSVSDYRYVF
jgi:hypothetical protein